MARRPGDFHVPFVELRARLLDAAAVRSRISRRIIMSGLEYSATAGRSMDRRLSMTRTGMRLALTVAWIVAASSVDQAHAQIAAPQACQNVMAPRTTVFFVNGVTTTLDDARLNAGKLELEFLNRLPGMSAAVQANCHVFALNYNPTGEVNDFFEAAQQQLDITPTRFWLELDGLNLFTRELIRDALEGPMTDLNRIDASTIERHAVAYREQIASPSCRRVLIVPHSPGQPLYQCRLRPAVQSAAESASRHNKNRRCGDAGPNGRRQWALPHFDHRRADQCHSPHPAGNAALAELGHHSLLLSPSYSAAAASAISSQSHARTSASDIESSRPHWPRLIPGQLGASATHSGVVAGSSRSRSGKGIREIDWLSLHKMILVSNSGIAKIFRDKSRKLSKEWIRKNHGARILL